MGTNRPSVAVMINDAIATLNEKGGSSLYAIKKYIAATYKIDVQKLDSHLKKALKKGVESGSLTKPRGKGATGSFKLAVKSKVRPKPTNSKKAPTTASTAAKKPVTYPIAAKRKATASKASSEAKVPEVKVPMTIGPKPPAEARVPRKEGADARGFLYLLRIDLIVEELLRNLDLEDVLDLSLVSKDALIAVRNSKFFSGRLALRLCEESIRSRVLDNCFYTWKHVKFATYISDDEVVDYLPKSSTISQFLDSLQSFSFAVSHRWPSQGSLRGKIDTVGLKIIESSKETLEDLDLELYIRCSDLDAFKSIRCPNLKSLDLTCYGIDPQNHHELVEKLLKNLPPLEKLTIDVWHPSILFTDLQGRMSKLRELGIRINCRWCKDSTLARAFDWNLAAEMGSLEDLSIDLQDSLCITSGQDVEDLLLSIPATTVTKISLANFLGREVRFIQKLDESISRFTKSTELSLRILQSFDDDSLQGIIKGCPNLRNLALVGLNHLTDFGFSGVKKSPPGDRFHLGWENRGVSLTDLRDLTTLTIKWCDTISVATLLEVIRFESLTSLKFSIPVRGCEVKAKCPREFLLRILQQNPSLKTVYLKFYDDFEKYDDYDYYDSDPYPSVEDEARRLFPQIEELSFKYPPTEEYFDGSDSEYSESDSESSDSDRD